MSVGVEQRLDRFWRYLDKHFVAARLFPILWILAIGGITFLWKLGSTGLVDETEPLFAEAARQMVETGDWITPYFNGVTRFDKPPLIYWLMAIAYKIIGVNEWAARLPSALSAIALMGMGFYILRRFGTFTPGVRASSNQRWLAALIGSALIALHPLTIIWAKTGVSDMLLSGCVGLALMSFFCGYGVGEQSEVRSQEPGVRSQKVEEEVEERDDAAGNLGIKIQNSKSLRLGFPTFQSVPFSGCYLGFYVFVALAVLTKGPVGIVLPGLIVGTFLLYVGNFKTVLREMRPLWGFLVILVLALPWYILVTLANGETFIDSFFGYHNIERFTSVVNHHWAPWYFYFVIVLLGFAPWSLYLPSAILETLYLAQSASIFPFGLVCILLVRLCVWIFYHRGY